MPDQSTSPSPVGLEAPVMGPVATRRRPSMVLSILAILAFVGMVPLALMGWQVAKRLSRDLASAQQEAQLDKGETIAAAISQYVEDHFGRLEVIAAAVSTAFLDPAGSAVDEAKLRQLLERYRLGAVRDGQSEEVYELRLVPGDDSKPPVAVHAQSFDPAAHGKELEPEIAIAVEKGRRGVRYLSNPFLPPGFYHPLVVVAVPVRSAEEASDGRGSAVLAAVVSLSPFQRVVQRGESLSGYTAFVLDDSPKPRPFAHTQFTKVLERQDLSGSALVQDYLQHGVYSASLEFQEKDAQGRAVPMIGSYVPVPVANRRWAVFVQVEREVGFSQVRQMHETTIKWGIAAFVLAVVIGIVFSLRMTAPIHELTESTRRVAGGEYGRKVVVRSNNELGMLADNFNVMSDEIRKTVDDLTRQKEINDQLFLSSIRSLAAAIDARDPYTRGHSERVRRYARTVARQLNLGAPMLRTIEVGALLHDIGKIGIEDRILRKPSALTPEEFEIMKTHPEKGGDIMEPITSLREATEIILHHHERWDGSGYPSGLKGDEIPLGARIVNVADTFDAMTTNRPYQRAMTFSVAAKKIGEFAGRACDPRVVLAFQQAMEAGLFGQVESESRAG